MNQAWFVFSGADERLKAEAGEFHRMARQFESTSSVFADQIASDLHRTFPCHRLIDTDAGIQALKTVLGAYSIYNPRIGYCQSMNYLCAFILLVMDFDLERSFFVLAQLIEVYLPRYFSPDLAGMHVRSLARRSLANLVIDSAATQTDQQTLQELVREKMPEMWRHFDEHSIDVSTTITPWFMLVFVTILPAQVPRAWSRSCRHPSIAITDTKQTTLRVWDMLFYECRYQPLVVLYSTALAILQYLSPKLLRNHFTGTIMTCLQQDPKLILDTAALVEARSMTPRSR